FLSFINQLSIPIIEDCAQSLGTSFKRKPTGTFGKIGCFSFYPTKNLGALGDAGAIITDDIKVYSKLLKLRQYGWNNNKVSIIDGYNTRIDEIQSLILRIKFKYFKKNISKKNTIAKLYNDELRGLPILTPKLKKNVIHSFHLYVIRVNASVRNKLIKFLQSKKIFCSIHYKRPLHKMPIAKKYFIKSDLKNTNKIVNEIISLPMYAELKKYEVIYIIKQIKLFYSLNK
ncbi:uncharacterized protein METZ01_LOCUS359780, partial [marine metagenome]